MATGSSDSLSSAADDGAVPRGARHLAFHARAPPSISVPAYLSRLLKYAMPSKDSSLVEAVVLHALVLIERIQRADDGFLLCTSNVHRLVLTTLLLSSKCLDDEPYSNSHWARAGGVPTEHLNALELHATVACEFELNVTFAEVERMRHNLPTVAPSPPASAVRGVQERGILFKGLPGGGVGGGT